MTQTPAFIPYGRHSIDNGDVEAVLEVLNHQLITQGDAVPRFEQALTDYTGAEHALAVSSGTAGLHVACLAAGLGEGDILWTVPNSFVASANCALYCGARVDFVDIDPLTRNISLDSLATKLTEAECLGTLPKVLITVHFAGFSCDMRKISKLIQAYGIILIEDAAHALGGSYSGEKTGCCRYSDMTVFSFHPVKSITTAEGGAVMTSDERLYKRLELFAKHGVSRDQSQMSEPSHGPWHYQQLELGYNYRLSDLQAALGQSQLNKLDDFIARREQLASNYHNALQHLPLKLPHNSADTRSAWHLYVVEVEKHNRKALYQQLHERGIGVNVHYIPIHLQPYYRKLGFAPGDFPVAERFYQNNLTIPLFPAMSADEQSRVIQALNEVLA